MPRYKQECPICEFVFEANIKADHKKLTLINCTYCSHSFLPSRSEQVAEKLPAKKLPTLLKKSTTQSDQSVTIGKSDNLRSSIKLKRMQTKRRSNFLLLLLFLGAIASVGYLFYRFNDLERQRQQQLADSNSKAIEANQTSIPVPQIAAIAQPAPSPSQSPDKESARKVPQTAPTTTQPVKPAQPPKFQFLSASKAADEAALARPYLVLLEIESPLGTTYATGTIVDSRGYVLTSLSAVIDATKIIASPARKASQIQRAPTPPISDTVRSVLAISRSQQWVLLEINRRLVLNANDISIPLTDRVVSRQPLLRVIAPQLTSDYAVSEMRVDSRKKSNELTDQEQQLLNLSDLKEDQEVNWIVSPHSRYDRLGAVLISTEGKLMAMLVNSDDRFSYFISATEIATRLGEHNFSKMPLSELSRQQ